MDYICTHCGYENYSPDLDKIRAGFWCDCCDSYSYLDDREQHKISVIVENKSDKEAKRSLVKASLDPKKLNKRLSPLRYPGGKSKMINALIDKLNPDKLEVFVEPFAGGASFGLALLDAGAIEKLILNDKDKGVYALHWAIKHSPDQLIARVLEEDINHEAFFRARKSILTNEIDDLNLLAWQTLLVNRTAYSGILKANPLGGRNGSIERFQERFNRKNIAQRITRIHGLSDRIEVHNEDALEVIEEAYWHPRSTLFIDPPYVAKGKQLYLEAYEMDDHIKLSSLLHSLHLGMPGGDVIVTYDNDPLIQDLYGDLMIEEVSRYYSIGQSAVQ